MRGKCNGKKAFFIPIRSAAEKHKMIKRLTKRGYPRGSFKYVRYISHVVCTENKEGGVNNGRLQA